MLDKFEDFKSVHDILQKLAMRYDGYGIFEHVLKKKNISGTKYAKKIKSLYFDADEWAQRWHLLVHPVTAYRKNN